MSNDQVIAKPNLTGMNFIPPNTAHPISTILSDLEDTLFVDGAHVNAFSTSPDVLSFIETRINKGDFILPKLDILTATGHDNKKDDSQLTFLTRVRSDGEGLVTFTNYDYNLARTTMRCLSHMRIGCERGNTWDITPILPTGEELSERFSDPLERRNYEDTQRSTSNIAIVVAVCFAFYETEIEGSGITFKHRLKDQRKYTSIKTQLMKDLVITKVLKKMKLIGREVNMAGKLESSVLFTDIELDTAASSKLPAVSFENLPFEDFMILVDAYWEKNPELVKDGFLFRLKRTDKGRTFLFSYAKAEDKKFYLKNILEVMPNDSLKTHLSSPESDHYIHEVILGMKRFIWLITNYERTVRHTPTKHQLKQHETVPGTSVKDLFVEYTMDLTKPISKAFKGTGATGTHASPIEHERIGYYRKSKNGLLHFVSSCTVNKGNKGRLERDYKVT